jgi:gamma-glutamylputrescine oxidase
MQLSYWEKDAFYGPADVVIAGSGFTGLWTALHLKNKHPELKVTLIERGSLPTGASTRNAGFACFGSVTELMKDVHESGVEAMLSLVEMRYRGLKRIRKLFSKKEIDFMKTGGYELFTSVSQDRYKELKAQIRWLNHVLDPVLKKKTTFSFADDMIPELGLSGVSHLIFNQLEGVLHPGKLCKQLLTKVQEAGVTVLTDMEIIHLVEHSRGVTIETSKGLALETHKLMICTNGFARQLLPDLDVFPRRGQVLLTAPVPGLKIKGSFHFDEGFYYFRNIGDRLLLGGARNTDFESENTAVMETSRGIQSALENFMETHLLKDIEFEITDRWTGIMGFGKEKTPLICEVSSNIYCAVRLSGMGVALAPVIGERAALMVAG